MLTPMAPIVDFAIKHHHTVLLAKAAEVVNGTTESPWVQQTVALVGRGTHVEVPSK